MRIVADANIPGLDTFFAHWGSIERIPGRSITASDVRHADILLVRSVTRVDRSLLKGSSVRFVGSCTIGRDHVNEADLADMGIGFAAAPGCNAQAVVEYVLACFCFMEVIHGMSWRKRRLGIVGCGHVGGLFARVAMRLGMEVCACDPWLEQAEVPLLPLNELLTESDIVSIHVPLVDNGPWPTRHLLSAPCIQRMKKDAWLINTARGEVLDESVVLQEWAQVPDRCLMLDVWPGEPVVSQTLLARTVLGTPHVAGYSYEGKWRGTAMVYAQVLRFFGQELEGVGVPEGMALSSHPLIPLTRTESGWDFAKTMLKIVPVMRDDAALRTLSAADAAGFDRLRSHYPHRFECAAYGIPRATVVRLDEISDLMQLGVVLLPE